MSRSSTRPDCDFYFAGALLLLTSIGASFVGTASASIAEPSISAAPQLCQAEPTDDQADQAEESEDDDSGFFLWLEETFSTQAGPDEDETKPGYDRDEERLGGGHDGGGRGGNGGGGGGGGAGGGGH